MTLPVKKAPQKNTVLAVILTLLALAYLCGLRFARSDTTLTARTTALLNPKYRERVNLVTISPISTGGAEQEGNADSAELAGGSGGGLGDPGALTLRRERSTGNWYCSVGGASFLAERERVAAFLDAASQTATLYETGNSYSDWSASGLLEETRTTVTFSEEGERGESTVFSTLYFGFLNAAENRIFVAGDRRATVYSASDKFSAFVGAAPGSWAVMELFPLLKDVPETAVSHIDCAAPAQSGYAVSPTVRRLYAGDRAFSEVYRRLCSIRAGGLDLARTAGIAAVGGVGGSAARDPESAAFGECAAAVTVTLLDGRTWECSFFEVSGGAPNQLFAVSAVTEPDKGSGGAAGSGVGTEQKKSTGTVFTVSRWTYDTLMALLKA